jgi:nucleotide-binding universal stress UspA family protein
MFDRVLVPVDGSDESARALEQGVAFARAVDANLDVVTVVDVRDLDTAADVPSKEAAGEDLVAETLAQVDTDGVPVTTAVERGVPDETIRTYATDHDVDLVVMGTHGRTGVRRFVLGSVTEKVLRLSDVPVLVVHVGDADHGVPYEDILVPTDGSEGAAAAIDPAAALATIFDATVHVVSVVDTSTATIEAGAWDMVGDSLQVAAEDAVAETEAALADRGVQSVETAVRPGSPYRVLREYVTANDLDLVVMGTHGRSGIERYLLGSVTEKLVRTSPTPVLTVRFPGDDD